MSAALAVGELLPLVRFDPLQVQYVAVAAVGVGQDGRGSGRRARYPQRVDGDGGGAVETAMAHGCGLARGAVLVDLLDRDATVVHDV